MFALMVGGSILMSAPSFAQSTKDQTQQQQGIKFYYYPSSNVYYNTSTSEYEYYDEGSSTWVTVKELPSTITLVKTPVYTVYHNDAEVWKDNAEHLKKYKVNKEGKVKAKPKDGQ